MYKYESLEEENKREVEGVSSKHATFQVWMEIEKKFD